MIGYDSPPYVTSRVFNHTYDWERLRYVDGKRWVWLAPAEPKRRGTSVLDLGFWDEETPDVWLAVLNRSLLRTLLSPSSGGHPLLIPFFLSICFFLLCLISPPIPFFKSVPISSILPTPFHQFERIYIRPDIQHRRRDTNHLTTLLYSAPLRC